MPWWVKVDADLDDHPKACAAGFDACALFQFFLRVNGRREFEGRIPGAYWSTPYVQRKTGLDATTVDERIRLCLDAGLLEADGPDLLIAGWDCGEWGIPASTNAERQKKLRERRRGGAQDDPDPDPRSHGPLRARYGEVTGRDGSNDRNVDRPTDRPNIDRPTDQRARARGEGQDVGRVHALTDVSRVDLDADPRPKREPPPSSESVPPEDPAKKRAREVADSAAERWKALRLVIAPNDRACQAGTWDVDSITFKGRLLPHARELGDELVPAITWAMADVRRGPGFPGWRTVLRTPAKVLDALDEGALIEQFRAQRDAPPGPPPRAGAAAGNVRLYDSSKGSWEVPPAEANRLERQREQAARDRAATKASKLEQWRRYLRLGADVPAAEVMRQAKAAAESGNGPLERGGEPTRVGEAIKEAIR